MARLYNPTTVSVLSYLDQNTDASLKDLKASCAKIMPGKDFYNYLFRLQQSELVEKIGQNFRATPEGKKLLYRLRPEKDGVWKLVIFDIPEKHKYVRTVLRAKLKQLHFKKWQNSIWASPFKMDAEIEKEFDDLGKKFFVRLIKVSEINNPADLQRLFPEK